ncbi:MAG: aminopeptidase [Bacteroidales bacterium]|jgi:bleomycin hydrolase|nr:aminopeptidase [Bacteroidales bacterium]
MKLRVFFAVFMMFFVADLLFAGNSTEGGNTEEGYVFSDEKILPFTPVKDQYRSGTCWSFSGLSLLESEMMRLGKPEVDLSEMFVVWHTYSEKAKKHVRMHGNLNFSAGGAFHDVINMIKKYGIVPESVYNGLVYGESKHVHGEMDSALLKYANAVAENESSSITTAWHEAVEDILDSYIGKIPQNFDFNGKQYTPQSFSADYVGLNMDNYVEITSYTHHPFYSKFILEVPDNWSWDEIYNVPLNEMMSIIDYALKNGFTVAWAADVSEKGFVNNKGIAVLPAAPANKMTDVEVVYWETLPELDRENKLYELNSVVPELTVTQEMRQRAFDIFETTDDHGMHIVGVSRDQYGNEFYKVKNSWGDYNKYNGFLYASKPYIAYKTMSIMLHKDAIPQTIREKLKL